MSRIVIGTLKLIFERLSNAPEEKKILPFDSEKFDSTTKEE